MFWTDPYRFFTTGQPGITAATAYRDLDGRISVVGIDIALTEAHDQMRIGLKTLLKLERDLQVARQMQENTLPKRLPELPGIDLSASLTDLVIHINQQLKADLPTGRFITAWFGLLDMSDSTLSTFSAGQAPLVFYNAKADEFDVLGSDAIPLGMFPAIQVQSPEPIRLEPGDIYAVLSDGFFEAKHPDGEEQGTERICEIIRRMRQGSAKEIQAAIRQATEAFTHGTPDAPIRLFVQLRWRR